MPFVLNEYKLPLGKKIQLALLQDLDMNHKVSQKMISKGRIFNSKKRAYKNGDVIEEESVFIAEFEGHTRGLQPLITFDEFAIFDKPSNLMVHPSSRHSEYTLLDEIRYHFGKEANQAHRIDAETSGLLLVGRNDTAKNALAEMFELKQYKKSYLAIVEGKLENEQSIDLKIDKENKNIGVRMQAGDRGKESHTIVKPLQYNAKRDITLVEAIPITGRQHQIRVHLYAIGHRIIGDPIYGVEDDAVEAYLNKQLTQEERLKVIGHNRLWLHANYLEFTFKERTYKLFSKNREIYEEFQR